MDNENDSGLDDLEAEYGEPAAPVAAPVKAKKKAAPRAASLTTRIQVEDNDEIPPTGLYVGHNGRGYLIRTGEPVDVPNPILEILDNAVMLQPQFDPQTRRVVGYRRRMRYPYRRV